VVASWSATGAAFPVGSRLPLGGRNAHTLVFRTRQPARISDYAGASGPAGKAAREFGFRASVSVPVTVEGGLWGVLVVEHTREEPLPPRTEARLTGFTELAATAIANAEAQSALTASRARIVATADATRRRIERNLHDGAQQRLVSLALDCAPPRLPRPPGPAEYHNSSTAWPPEWMMFCRNCARLPAACTPRSWPTADCVRP
jgi:GAF domain-containing protein